MEHQPLPLQTHANGATGADTGVAYWRQRLLQGLLTVALALGLLVALPTAVLAIAEGQWAVVVVDTLALALTAVLHRRRDLPYRWRSTALLGGLYLLGLALLLQVGALTQIYLLSVPVLSAVLLGRNAALTALAACTLSVFVAGYAAGADPGVSGVSEHLLGHWLRVTLNFLLVAAMLTVSCAYLLRGLEGALERERANLARLRENEMRFAAIFDIVPEALALWKRGEDRLVEVNRGFEALTGWSRDEALQRTEAELALLGDDTRERLAQVLQTGSGRSTPLEGTLRTRHGEDRQVVLSTATLVLGDQAYALTVAQDVTEARAQETALRESTAARRAAEVANRLKSDFLAMISHEVRTPLGGMMGMLRSARRDTQVPPGTRTKLDLSLQHAEMLLQLINDLLDYSKMEAGRMTLERLDVDLPALLHDVSDLLAERAEAKGITLTTAIAPDLPAWWLTDPTRLRQLAMNLIGNAIKFTEQGEVRVSLDTLADGGVVLTVRDTGIGIAAHDIPRLFEKFEQVDAATSRKYGGTGLGLPICRHIVEAMGGRIEVSSEPGRGSCFSVALPLAPGRPSCAASTLGLGTHPVSLAVLCAEDGSTNQIILRELLDEMGHQATLVVDGQAALAAMAERDFDLLLLDSRMPVMDGLTTLRHLRAGDHRVRNPQLPVLALTANASIEERQRFLDAGADGFLTKPIDESALHAAIGGQIERLLAQGLVPVGERTQNKPGTPTLAELDALFGLAPGPAAPSPAMRAAFGKEGPRLRDALRDAVSQGAADAVALAAHTLKGSAAYLGAQALSDLCGRIEQHADSGDLLAVEPLLATLDLELEHALTPRA